MTSCAILIQNPYFPHPTINFAKNIGGFVSLSEMSNKVTAMRHKEQMDEEVVTGCERIRGEMEGEAEG